MRDLVLKIGDEEIAACKPCEIETKSSRLMEYYYRRGNKHFFRDAFSKLVINTSDEIDLKRGKKYEIEWS